MGENQEKSEEGEKSRASQQESASNDSIAQKECKSKATGSSPIEIKQVPGTSKFAVLTSRSSPDPSGIMTDSNGEPIPIDSIIKTANTMSSMMMAHKIALEDDFRLEPGMDISGPMMSISPIIGSSPSRGAFSGGQPSEPNLQSRVKDIVLEAYWDLFKEELNSQSSEVKEERKFDISKQLLRDIRQKIIDLLLPQHARLKQDIEDKLDSQILDQLSRVESLNLLEYAKYILTLLSKLCAPVRDEKLKELGETTDTVKLYRGIMELLELMRLDLANFTLNRFKPHIKAHSQEYEREKFEEILKQQQSIGIDGLEYTKLWLGRAVERVNTLHGISDLINESSNIDQGELNSQIMTASTESDTKIIYTKEDKILKSDIINKVLNAGYCELLEWTPEKQKLYPETLLFDESTFKQLGEQYKVLVLTSSILLTTFAFVNRFKLHENNEFRNLAKSHVITLLTASYNDNQPSSSCDSPTAKSKSLDEYLDQVKLETIAVKLCDDIKQKLEETDKSLIETLEIQSPLFKGQILDLQNSNNRIRELARRRILEFVDTLLSLDVEHQQKKISAKMVPPVNIPLGLNCLADEVTLTMAQLVKIIRYNRIVFFQHYQDIIVEIVSKLL